MVIGLRRVDDHGRGRPRQEPSRRSQETRPDSGRSLRTQRRPGGGGQQDRAGQTRSAGFDAGKTGRRGRGPARSAARLDPRHGLSSRLAASKSSRSARSRVRPAACFIAFKSAIEQTATGTPRISASLLRESDRCASSRSRRIRTASAAWAGEWLSLSRCFTGCAGNRSAGPCSFRRRCNAVNAHQSKKNWPRAAGLRRSTEIQNGRLRFLHPTP